MIDYLSDSISGFFVRHNIISDDERSIYKYGAEITISTLIGIVLILTSGIILKNILDSIIFLLCFIFIRIYSGGYHCDTYLKCNITFIGVYLLRLLIKIIVPLAFEPFFSLVLMIISMTIIFIFSPLENINKPLVTVEVKKYRKISILLSSCWCVLSVIAYFINLHISRSIVLTMFSIAILMIAEIITKK